MNNEGLFSKAIVLICKINLDLSKFELIDPRSLPKLLWSNLKHTQNVTKNWSKILKNILLFLLVKILGKGVNAEVIF